MSDDPTTAYAAAADRYKSILKHLVTLQRGMQWAADALLAPGKKMFAMENAPEGIALKQSSWPSSDELLRMRDELVTARQEAERLRASIRPEVRRHLTAPPWEAKSSSQD